MGSRCRQCGAVYLPLRPICTRCYACEMEMVEMKGSGRLLAFSVITVGTPMMIDEGFDRENPYCSGIVELEEGVRIPARILGVDVTRPEEIKLGTPLTVEFQEREYRGEKKTVLAFKA